MKIENLDTYPIDENTNLIYLQCLVPRHVQNDETKMLFKNLTRNKKNTRNKIDRCLV